MLYLKSVKFIVFLSFLNFNWEDISQLRFCMAKEV